MYLDLACSDCALTWPVLSRVAEAYGHQAEFLYRLFPLPYHRNAFTAAKVRRSWHLMYSIVYVVHDESGQNTAVHLWPKQGMCGTAL